MGKEDYYCSFDWLVREVYKKKKWNMKEGKIQMVSS